MKLYEILSKLSYRLRFEATYCEMKYHLKRVLKGKETSFFKTIGHYDRQIGKSCALARLSVKYDIPIIVPYTTWTSVFAKDIPRLLPKYFKKKRPITIVITDYTTLNFYGGRWNAVLIDEGLPKTTFDLISSSVKRGIVGYKPFY